MLFQKILPEKFRIDQLLVSGGFYETRHKAQAAILTGDISINGEIVTKPGKQVVPAVLKTLIIKQKPKYVSRGGFKLEKALAAFQVSPIGKVCIDVGSSTGGFTDCLLQNGAIKVYDIDCGTNQLDYKIRTNPNVVVLEKTNARSLLPNQFDPIPILGVMDVSFISITKLLPVLKNILGEEGELVVLIKPQFEGSREMLDKGGIVRNVEYHNAIIKSLWEFFIDDGWIPHGLVVSPIKGGKGNIEYLVHLLRTGQFSFTLDAALSQVSLAFSGGFVFAPLTDEELREQQTEENGESHNGEDSSPQ